MVSKNLKLLEDKSSYILREIKNQFKKIAVLWSTGKDSTTMLYLIKKTFGNIPWPVIHIDTGYKFPEIYKFRDELAKKWNMNLVIVKNEKALKEGMRPKKGKLKCCSTLKTETLKNYIQKNGYDAIIVSIRRDEQGAREKEHYMSPRDKKWHWRTTKKKSKDKKQEGDSDLESLQDPEFSGWNMFFSDFGGDTDHVRAHPILHWTEQELWEYIKEEKIPFNQMYLAKNGRRFRSLGCQPCTSTIPSNADNIDKIVQELKTTKIKERDGRAQDKEKLFAMQRLRTMGYM